jgi:hypothetical protein
MVLVSRGESATVSLNQGLPYSPVSWKVPLLRTQLGSIVEGLKILLSGGRRVEGRCGIKLCQVARIARRWLLGGCRGEGPPALDGSPNAQVPAANGPQ